MLNSIKWRFIAIYILLVFVGMLVAGVFIVQSFENYNFEAVDKKIQDISELILPDLQEYFDLYENSENIQKIIDNTLNLGIREEIYVVSAKNNLIIATTTSNRDRNAGDILDFSLLLSGFNGDISSGNMEINSGGTVIRTKDVVFPIEKENKIVGVLYFRYDLKEVYDNLNSSMNIIIKATLLAIIITILIGFFIAKGITEPLNEMTDKASKMAQGDFKQVFEVKSNDEIGKLGEMFNLLTKKLDTTLIEVSKEKSKLETIINYMDDGLIAVTKKGNIIHSNWKLSQMLNLKDDNLENFDDFIKKYDEKLMISHIISEEKTWMGNSLIYMEESIYKVNYAPYKNNSGEFDGIVYVFQDVTEQQKLDNMRRDFVANVSHELKTPLTSIKSYTETILDGAVDDKNVQRQFLEVVNSEADRMTRLVRDLLQLSNFDSKKVVFDKDYDDYVDLINKVILKMKVSAENKNQKLKFITDSEKIIGCFDFYRIEQVLINILSNAIKYTKENGDISIYVNEEDGNIDIVIKDTGMGIPEKDLEFVFDRFYRVDKARSREMGGTGLGLSIAKEIIDAHNGTIEITSKLDFGTTVAIIIPLEESKNAL